MTAPSGDATDLPGPDPSDRWPADIEPIIAARSTGATHDDIAASVGKSTKTVARRLALPGVAQEIIRRQIERFDVTRARMVTNSDRAACVLAELLDSEDDRVRMRAAEQTLAFASRFHHQALVEHNLVSQVEAIDVERTRALAADEQEARYAATQAASR